MSGSDLVSQFLRRMVRWMRLSGARQVGDLSRGELFVLQWLAGKREAPAGELGTAMDISTARVAALLNSMERKGWVKRLPDPQDRRKIRVRLTEAGEAVAAREKHRIHAYTEKVLAELGEADAREFLRILDRLIDISERELQHRCTYGKD